MKGATVTIGGEATEVVVVSATEITAKTAAHAAGAVEVVVEDEKGKSAGGPKFTYVTPPTVEKVTPSSGSTLGGTAVVVKGTGFVKGATVKIGSAATAVEVVSATEIKAKTAATAAGEDEVVVTIAGGGASKEGPKFTYITPPSVSKVEPATGSTLGGTKVVITGTGFTEGATVKIGSAATEVEVVSETEIKAKTAATVAGADSIVVTDSKGVSAGGPTFTYVAPPKVTSVEPATGPTTGGTTVKVKGTGFLKGSTVAIGEEATSVKVVSETELTAVTAAHAAGAVEVVVTSEMGSSSAGPKFTYVTPPTVTKVEPASGSTLGGTAVVIKGTGFVAGATVKIGSAATGVEVVSATEIKAKTAATAAGEDEVVVTIAGGGASKEGPKFTYITPPSVTAVAPAEGSTAGGAAVKLTGTGFVKGATVTIGGEATEVVVVSATEITAKTAAHAAGAVEVVVEDEKGKSAGGPKFTYVTPPTVEKVTPSSGSTLGGTAVVVKGTGFVKGATVKIGSAATAVEVVSATEIKAKTAATAAGEDEVVVTIAGGGASKEGPKFTYITPPSVSKVEPATGSTLGGTKVVITGTGFTEGATVKIGSAATEVEVVSETEIKAKTAATVAGADSIVVTDSKGVSAGGPTFTYVAPPKVTSVEPATGPTTGGTTVKVKGTGFLKGSTVAIGEEATSVKVVSETELTAVTAAHAAGAVEVVVTSEMGCLVGWAEIHVCDAADGHQSRTRQRLDSGWDGRGDQGHRVRERRDRQNRAAQRPRSKWSRQPKSRPKPQQQRPAKTKSSSPSPAAGPPKKAPSSPT